MLVISRKRNEAVVINDDITVQIVDIRGDKVRIGIDAPKDISVHREEVVDFIRTPRVVADLEPDHQPFAEAILASPYDDNPRLVYADWLEEQADPRCEYLRLECELNGLQPGDALYEELQPRFEEIRNRCPRKWLALLGRSRIMNCRERFRRCPARWECLVPLSQPGRRFCNTCKNTVYFCWSSEEITHATQLSEQIAIDSGISQHEFNEAQLIGRKQRSLPPNNLIDEQGHLILNELPVKE